MKQPVAYKIFQKGTPWPIDGEVGLTYTWAGNGVFVEAESPLLAARIPTAEVITRGLANFKTEVVLKHGKIPQSLFDDILADMLLTPKIENYYGICWDDGYKIRKPLQSRAGDKVTYATLDNVVLDIHSHGDMAPVFSTQDNKDEQGLKLYGVAGLLASEYPCALLRVGVYGYFYYIDWSDVFEGASRLSKWQFVNAEMMFPEDK
jgi:PRTRC genetic system protein A